MAGFASGFFGTVANNISDKRDFIRNRVEEDRMYLREQGLKRQAAVTEQRGAYERVARSLIRAGADERTVLGTLEMDPEGLMEVYERTNGSDIAPAALNDMMQLSSEYQGDATMSEILDKILPTAVAMPKDVDPLTSRKNTFGAWLGLDTETELNKQVYSSPIVGGMTGDQIIASMNIPVAAQGTNPSGVTYDFSTVTPLSASDVNQHIATANSDYDAEWQAQQIADLQAQQSADDVTPEDLARIQEELKFYSELPRSGPARLQAILGKGIPAGPNTVALAERYGPRVFGLDAGFAANTLASILGTTEGNIATTEEEADNLEATQESPPPSPEVISPGTYVAKDVDDAEAAAVKAFEDDPDRQTFAVSVDGTEVIIEREEATPPRVPSRGAANTDPLIEGVRGAFSGETFGSGGQEDKSVIGRASDERRDRLETNRAESANRAELGSVKPVARPSVMGDARATADDESAFELVDRINGGQEDPTDLKGRISQAMMTENRNQRKAQLQSLIVDIQQNWTQSSATDALLLQLMRAMES